MSRRTTRTIVLAALGALLLVGLAASPAAADPPRPTDYRSTVTRVRPSLPAGFEVRVVGGDSFLELTVPRGHTAAVADYPTSADDESTVPYLRFDADGTVRRNAVAVATSANDSRYGTAADVPDPDAEPRWETVATDGTYAWHDHRIHWMSPTPPRVVADDGQVDLGGDNGGWAVPLTVDGTPTVVTGTLVLEASPSPLPWLALTALVLAVTIAGALRWGLRAASGAALVGSVAAAAVARTEYVPEGAGGLPSAVLPVIAAVAACVGLAPLVRVRLVAAAATAACLVGWAALRWTVLSRAVLPTTVAPAVDRTVTAVALGFGLGLAVALVWRPPARQPAPDPVPTASPTA